MSHNNRVVPSPIVIIEGHLLFHNRKIRELLDIRIWMETDEDIKLERRIVRDMAERARGVEDILKQYPEVRNGFLKHIAQLKEHADMVVLNNLRNRDHIPEAAKALIAYANRFRFIRPLVGLTISR